MAANDAKTEAFDAPHLVTMLCSWTWARLYSPSSDGLSHAGSLPALLAADPNGETEVVAAGAANCYHPAPERLPTGSGNLGGRLPVLKNEAGHGMQTANYKRGCCVELRDQLQVAS
jgi:hypothetical protein